MSDDVWYFAYGANMSARVLARRELRPAASAAAALVDWRLRFNKPGVFLLEPAFANIEPAPGEVVHGVAHRMRRDDVARLDVYEGPGYEHVVVDVAGAGCGAVSAIAYRAVAPRDGIRPSLRYRTVVAAAAREAGLPEDWAARIEAHPAHDVPLLSGAVTAYVHVVDGAVRWYNRARARTPRAKDER